MAAQPFHIVDVFAERQYAGNQLAVVEQAAGIDDETMQAIAREFGYSETTFIESTEPIDGGYETRIFTPEEEIPFAGHPTLGTAAVIRNAVAEGQPDEVVLNLPVGQIPVRVERPADHEILWMTQQPPEFGQQFDHKTLAAVLGIEPSDLDHDWPVQAVSTGLPTVIVPLIDREALTSIDVDLDAYEEFVAGQEAKNILVFCADPRDGTNDLAVRVFAHYYGVPEDPATGSANGCLAGYLASHEYFGEETVDVTVEQGYEMGRPSKLYLSTDASADPFEVEVGGRVIPTANGTLA
ncbi:MAG: PhzF family phenazine biosynthesis protein [Halobacteriales archaeon]|nr:PhzF family phenazine biosynthesis protein [Halobacteriales archaeon]